jgi:hypothetical protein
MTLQKIRLELARTKEFPEGNARCGYEIVAPLDRDGHLDLARWKEHKQDCTVTRFWENGLVVRGALVHTRRQWVFSYRPGEDDDEPIFKLDRHNFKLGEYISVTEHDGITRPFRVAQIAPASETLSK